MTLRSPLSFCNLQKKPVRLWYSAPLDTTNREMVGKQRETERLIDREMQRERERERERRKAERKQKGRYREREKYN